MIFELVIFLLPLAVGLYILVIGIWDVVNAWKTRSWNSVEGTIVHLAVWDASQFENNDYELNVVYEYEVDGEKYKSSRVRYAWTGNGPSYRKQKKFAREFYQQHKDSDKVKVYYNPNKPSVAVLETGLRPHSFFGVRNSVSILLFGALIVIAYMNS